MRISSTFYTVCRMRAFGERASTSWLNRTQASRVQTDPPSRSTGSRRQKLKVQAPVATVWCSAVDLGYCQHRWFDLFRISRVELKLLQALVCDRAHRQRKVHLLPDESLIFHAFIGKHPARANSGTAITVSSNLVITLLRPVWHS